MTNADLAKFCNLPVRAIVEMVADGLLHMPPTSDDLKKLSIVVGIWGKDRYIKLQLTKFTKIKRRKLAETSGLTKPESYAYNRLLMQRLEQQTSSARNLTVEEIADEINYSYKVPITEELKTMIKTMRWRVYKVDLADPVFADEMGRLIKRSELKRRLQQR